MTTTIRRACMNDVLKIPYLGLAVDGEVIPPPGPGAGEVLSSLLIDLVAEAPGNHIMAYLCASALESGKAKGKTMTIAIDECKCNILYKSMAPLQTLVCRLEEILGYAKKLFLIQVDVRGSVTCRAGNMFAELGYKKEFLHGQNICRWTKSTASTAAVASQASTAAIASQASTSQAPTAAVASQAPTAAVASQAPTAAVASQASTSQAPTAAVASQASTADDASQASTADDASLEDIKAELTYRETLDCGAASIDPSLQVFCGPSILVSRVALHMSMSRHIDSACNSEFDLEDSGSDGEVGVSEFRSLEYFSDDMSTSD